MALIACNECGERISSEANACPNCGMRRHVRRFPISTRVLVSVCVIAAIAIIIVFGRLAIIGGSPDRNLISDLADKKESCQAHVRELESLGIRITRSAGSTSAEFDELYWTAYEHGVKVQQAMLFYCADMPPSGNYTVYIKGLKSRKILASIHDGNYSDGE